MLLLCALMVGSRSAWAQSDYSATYTSNVTLSATGGTKATASKVKISSVDYDAMKLGSNGNSGNFTINVPAGTKYLHLHVAAWTGKTSNKLTLSSGSPNEIALTANTGISGTTTTYTFSGDANTSDYYKVVTFATALASATDVKLTCSERCVIWGVNAEILPHKHHAERDILEQDGG